MSEPKPFWERPLGTLSRDEWEALCDGCGQCCLHKVEDADTGTIYSTNVACRLLDLKTGQCADYRHRKAQVPDCLKLTPRSVGSIGWLPQTCAYRLRAEDRPLPEWHYLLSGDREAVRRAGVSVAGKAVSELVAGPLENHIVWTGDEDFEVLGVEVVEGHGSPWAEDDGADSVDGADGEAPGKRGRKR